MVRLAGRRCGGAVWRRRVAGSRGWQRKMEPFPASLDRILTPLPGNYRRGVIDGHAVIYDPLTMAIYDTLQLI